MREPEHSGRLVLRDGRGHPGKACHEADVTPIARSAPGSRPHPPLMCRRSGLAPGLLAGTVLDALVADPRAAHPVAAFGSLAARAEARLWADSRLSWVLFTAACVG